MVGRVNPSGGDEPGIKIHRSFRFRIGKAFDPGAERCWFCDREIEPSEGGWLELTPFGDGEPLRGVSHRDCAERAKGSLATF